MFKWLLENSLTNRLLVLIAAAVLMPLRQKQNVWSSADSWVRSSRPSRSKKSVTVWWR